jgi:hypothetical protein
MAHYCTYNILNQVSNIHTPAPYFLTALFDITLYFHLRFIIQCDISLSGLTPDNMCSLYFPSDYYMPCPSYVISYCYRNNVIKKNIVWRRASQAQQMCRKCEVLSDKKMGVVNGLTRRVKVQTSLWRVIVQSHCPCSAWKLVLVSLSFAFFFTFSFSFIKFIVSSSTNCMCRLSRCFGYVGLCLTRDLNYLDECLWMDSVLPEKCLESTGRTWKALTAAFHGFLNLLFTCSCATVYGCKTAFK